ncbi:OmpA family protein, partial [bacterium]|nr:OmpA family protein [bacterium]
GVMSRNRFFILVLFLALSFASTTSSSALDALSQDWWGSPDYAEDYINSWGLNSYSDNLLKIAEQDFKNGYFDLAIKNLRESIKYFTANGTQMHPRLSEAYMLLGKIYYKLNRNNDAIYCFEKAYYSYGYLYNLDAYCLLETVKQNKKISDVEQLFAHSKVVIKPTEEETSESPTSKPAKEEEPFELVIPPEFFDMAHFAFDSSDLTEAGKKVLDLVAEKLKDHPYVKIMIDGYCDSKGSVEYNLKLGERRAKSAKNYLVEVHNINPDNLLTRSYGKDAPIDTNETEAGRAKNRRIQFTVQYPDSETH